MPIALLLAALVAPMELAAAAKEKPKATKPKPAPAKPAEPDDFDLLPKEKAPDAAVAKELELKAQQRRTMLQYHQIGGFATLGALTATAVFGQLNYLDKYGGGGDTGKYRLWHLWLGYGSALVFAGTASLAVFAPVPIEKKARLDTAMAHKIFMTVAAAGMVTQIVLGIVTAGSEGSVSQRNYALAHQIIGYTTVAASYAGFGILTF